LSGNRQAGFTLIEVAAVMLIIALLASLVVTLTPGTGRAQLKAVALQTAAFMRRERLDAILSGRARRITLDNEKRALVGAADGGSVPIPRDIVLELVGVDQQWSGNALVVGFEPDGAATGAVLRLSREGAHYEIQVNWYTGAVTVIP
jgi:general secretion pathway protein H